LYIQRQKFQELQYIYHLKASFFLKRKMSETEEFIYDEMKEQILLEQVKNNKEELNKYFIDTNLLINEDGNENSDNFETYLEKRQKELKKIYEQIKERDSFETKFKKLKKSENIKKNTRNKKSNFINVKENKDIFKELKDKNIFLK
jgi:hypothetical protein